MSASFNIFRQQPDGNAYWVEATEDLEAATARVRVLAKTFPSQYIVVDEMTGEKVFIPPKQ